MKLLQLLLLLTAPLVLYSQATKPFSYGGPWGGSMNNANLESNTTAGYPSPPGGTNEHQLAATGDFVQLNFSSTKTTLFTVKLIAKVGSGAWNGTVELQSSADGSSWTTLQTITSIGNNNASITPSNIVTYAHQYVRVYFTNKVSGSNLGVDDFAVADNVLPVNLTSFTGRYEAPKGIQLNWQTAQEVNNSHFEVERSANGAIFHQLGQVDGNRNSTTVRNYTFLDAAPAAGLNYYRLRQVDLDGTSAYSPVIVVNGASSKTLRVYPNPTAEQLTIQPDQTPAVDGIWTVYDLQGRKVLEGNYPAETTTLPINVSELAAGFYSLRLALDQEVRILAFVKE